MSHIWWTKDALARATKVLESSLPNETALVCFGQKQPDPVKPEWNQLHITDVLVPSEEDYQERGPVLLHLRSEFHEKIRKHGEKTGTEPLLGHHAQPAHEPSRIDVGSMQKLVEYYSNLVLGTYYHGVHSFFRLTEHGMEEIPWALENDEIDDRLVRAFGKETRQAIAGARILLVGAGGIGFKLAIDFSLKGYGWIDMVDPDSIDRSNLSRLSLSPSAVGRKKVNELSKMLQSFRPSSVVNAWAITIQKLPESRFSSYDLIVVATDNANSRLYCNDMSLRHRVPSIQVGATLENGQEAVSCRLVVAGFTPCYECYNQFTREQLSYDYMTAEMMEDKKRHGYGVPVPVPSVVDLNSLAAGLAGDMAFKFLTKTKISPYWYFDLKNGSFRMFSQVRNPKCNACPEIPDFDVEWLASTVDAKMVSFDAPSNQSNETSDRVETESRRAN